MQNTACHDNPGLLYWGELYKFMLEAPGAAATAATAAWGFLSSALWAGSQTAGAAGYKAAVAVLAPLGTVLAWVGWVCASHTIQILAAVLLFIAWQIYFPSRLLIRLLAKLPYCRGVNFEFVPAPDRPSGKYVALTIDDGPCPYNTTAVLDTLQQAGAKATFFIIGSQVEKCDVAGVGSGRNGGEGHYPLGQETLRRMYSEGHELGNHTMHDRPSHTLTPKQLSKEITDVHRIIHTARQAAVTAAFTNSDSDDNSASAAAAVTGPRTKWFRPGWGWFTPEVVDTAQKLGYHVVLGSVWPWDVYCKWPLLNALYIATKVYPGAVVVLHDRRRHLLPTLQYVLPWLNRLGYDVVNLSEASYRANGGAPQLTPAALEAHNKNHSSTSLVSMASGRSLDSAPQIQPSAAYLARMAKEHERAAMIAAMEEAEQKHLKALKRAEADRRAGIDRRLADMSAAEKRGIERREREKKEAEIRRARRKIEEAKARERYEKYVKERAERHAREKAEQAEAEVKAREAAERKRQAEEEYNKRKEAERKYAAEMVARQKAEREAREAEAAAAAAAAAALEITASEADDSLAADSSAAGDQADKKKRKGFSILKKIGGKAAQKLGVKDRSSSSKNLAAGAGVAAAAAAAAVGVAAGAAALSNDTDAAAAAADFEPIAAEKQVPDESYGWYGLAPSSNSVAALAKIDAAVAAYAATAAAGGELPAPVNGTYALGPGGRVLLGFDAQPLLLCAADGPDAEPILLTSEGQQLTGPNGEKIVMLLGANNMPLADPHGRPVLLAETEEGRLLGVHPDGSIITVPALTRPSAASSAGASKSPEQGGSAAASRRVSSSSASGDMVGAMSALHHTAPNSSEGSGSGSGSIKEASSYAPSLARTSIRSNISATAAAAAAAGLPPRSPTPAGAVTPPAAAPAEAAEGDSVAVVPAVLLLGPSGRPLLGLDNRPLIVAVDEDGMALVESPGGQLLLGPDSKPLQLGYASDGTMVALDNQCRPLVGPDGCSHVVALDRTGRPMADEAGRAIMVALSPAGFVVAEAAAAADTDAERVSWSGTASGNAAALLAAAAGGSSATRSASRYDLMLGAQADSSVPVIDAADYGAYSYNAATATAGAGAVAAAGVGAGIAAAAAVSAYRGEEASEGAEMVDGPSAGDAAAFEAAGDAVYEQDVYSGVAADQPAASSAAAGAAGAGEEEPAPAAWASGQAEPDTADIEPIGLDVFTTQEHQEQQEQEEQEVQEAAQQQAATEAPEPPAPEPSAAPAAELPEAFLTDAIAAEAPAAVAVAAAAAAAAAPQAHYLDDSDSPRSTEAGSSAAASYQGPPSAEAATQQQEQQQQQDDDDEEFLKPGKITLSAQGVRLTATSNSGF